MSSVTANLVRIHGQIGASITVSFIGSAPSVRSFIFDKDEWSIGSHLAAIGILYGICEASVLVKGSVADMVEVRKAVTNGYVLQRTLELEARRSGA